MGLHETLNIDGLAIDFSKPLSEKSYVTVIRYLFTDSDIGPRSDFFYKKISEDSYILIFHDLKENQVMLDFLLKLFLLSKSNFKEETQKELEFFFRYKKECS